MTVLGDLPTGQGLAFFDELGRLGVMDVTLTGGEAFTRPDLFELIDGIIANRMYYCVLSNDMLIDDKVLARFEIGKRRLHLDYIQVPIDGSRAEVHDRSWPNSFDRALRGLSLLKEAGFPVTVRVTIDRHNLYDAENFTHLLLGAIGPPSFGSNEAMPIGSGYCNEHEVSLTPVERAEAMGSIGRP